jgi:diguanylate cyclase (GGDEF)-like protein
MQLGMRRLNSAAKPSASPRTRNDAGPARVQEETRLAARSLGYLYLAGATIGLVSLLLPDPPRADVPALYSNVGLAYLGGAMLLFGVSRTRPWMLQVALAAGSLLITRAVLLSGTAVSFYSVWFIWVGLYAFFFFTRRVAAAHVAFVSILYAATLFADPPSSAVARWLTTVSTLIVAGVFIDTLVRRARRQASVAAESAQAMSQLTELAHGLAALSDPGRARLALCEGAARVTHAVGGRLWEPDDTGTDLMLTASADPDGPPGTASGRPPRGLTEAFATGHPVSAGGIPTAEPPRGGPGAGRRAGVCLWQPIMRDQSTVGVLELIWLDGAALEDPSTAGLTSLLAVEAAVTLQRVALLGELEAIARTDELTDLPNRRAWEEQLPREVRRADRTGAPLSVAMLDLDHFKLFNDSHGHQSGDRLLQQVARAWVKEMRPTDVLSRVGGEEFALALPDCQLAEATEVVERLRAATPGGETCSAGVANWNGSESASDLVGRADLALYDAKRNGRNQTATAGSAAAARAIA